MAKSLNTNLHKASKAKKDEFYTQLVDIEKELKHYKEQFRNKVVYCNCDDPFESNFFKYFASNFNALGLKRLIATSYKPSPVANTQLALFGDDKTLATLKGRPKATANKFIINEVCDLDGNGAFDLRDIAEQLKVNKNNEWAPLKGDGDFRSEESIELLRQADVVVSNPPFSLFREYIAQLTEYNKKFLIIGNVNAITYRECFKVIKDNRMWLGASIHSGDREFQVPDDYPLNAASSRIDDDGKKYIRVKGVRWFTNLDYEERHENLVLYKKYKPEEYPKYENYKGINVDKTSEIPMDYADPIGVPITFLDKYNPGQFDIIGLGISNSGKEIGVKPYKIEHKKYRKEVQKRGAVDGDLYMIKNGIVEVPYARVLIRNKKPQK
ncbi:MAG: modification methylase [Candidatus Moranbacteria bacterium]|nr:modification methylase [Candidatus Moranbacteria bacterium]